MAITTYAELQTAVADFAHRTDLTTVLPTLIRLAEDVIYGDLDSRQQDTQASLSTVANTETVALPTDFMSFRSLSISSGTRHETLSFLSPSQYAQEFQYDYTGTPRAYTVIGSNIHLQPIPDDVYTLKAIYEARLANLSVTNTTNWLLTNYPSAYLYATLMQVAIYTKDAEAGSNWEGLYGRVVQGINVNDWVAGNTMQVKSDVNLTNIRL
jgi:hypothetical protein